MIMALLTAVLAHHKRRAARIPFMHHDSILTNDMMSGFEYKIGPSHHGSFSREDFFCFHLRHATTNDDGKTARAA